MPYRPFPERIVGKPCLGITSELPVIRPPSLRCYDFLWPDVTSSWSEGIQAATIADIDGDGIKDGVAVVATLDAALNQNYSLQFARGMADGSYVQIKTTSRWPAAPLIWCGVI